MEVSDRDSVSPGQSADMTNEPLKRVPRDAFRVGVRLPGPLRDHRGKVLEEAGTWLTQQHCTRLDLHAVTGVYADSTWPEDFLRSATTPDAFVRKTQAIGIEELEIGSQLPMNLHDQSGVLLLSAGMTVTRRFVELLRRRNVAIVTLGLADSDDESQAPQHGWGEHLDAQLAAVIGEPIPSHPISRFERPRLPIADLRAEVEHGLKAHADASDRVIDACQRILGGRKVSSDALREPIAGFAKKLGMDFDLLPLIASAQTPANEYLFDHCVNVALLSMSIAAQLGWRQDRIMEVGLGALLQDIGMLRVPETIRLAPRSISPDERQQIEYHPNHTLGFLDGVRGLQPVVKYVAYQVHERWDASGYPGGRAGDALHPYSRVVSIADAYAAMTRPRPYRPPMAPYEASATILQQGADDKFDRVLVRAFLDATSLFPIGSYVALSDGSIAQVIRSNPGHHTQPVVEELFADGSTTGNTVDLTREPDLKVINTVDPALLLSHGTASPTAATQSSHA